MRFRRIYSVIALAAACTVFAAACLALRAGNASKLAPYAAAGERTFYLDSASSQGLVKTQLSLTDIKRVRGESVSIKKEWKNEAEKRAFAEEVFQRYQAEILLVERCAGTVSYYGYSPKILQTEQVAGKTVNLHVAVADSCAGVGIPLIYGGF